MRGVRLWYKTADGLRIYVKKGPVTVDGDNSYAVYDPPTNSITVRVDDEETMFRKLTHELTHRAMHSIPLGALEGLFGKDISLDEAHEREERLCEWVEQRLFDVMRPFLRFPKPPKFDK